jgi:hypothetical protein
MVSASVYNRAKEKNLLNRVLYATENSLGVFVRVLLAIHLVILNIEFDRLSGQFILLYSHVPELFFIESFQPALHLIFNIFSFSIVPSSAQLMQRMEAFMSDR